MALHAVSDKAVNIELSPETHAQLSDAQRYLAKANPSREVSMDDTVRLLIRVWGAAQDPVASQMMADLARMREGV